MNVNEKNPIINTPNVLYSRMNNSLDDINNRMDKRNYSDIPLQPNYDPRPVSTKYSHFPALNGRKPTHETLLNHPVFETNEHFNPGSSAPSSGYRNNVDLETILRNQTTVLQHGAGQGTYIPSSDSDLYKTQMPQPSEIYLQPHPELFTQHHFQPKQDTNYHPEIGQNMMFNHTRTQLRNT